MDTRQVDPREAERKRIQKEIGQRLRDRRVNLRLTQQEVAEAVGVSRESYAYYEAGTNAMPAVLVPMLSRVLRMPEPFIFGDPGDEADADEVAILAAWKGAPPQLRPVALRMLMAILREEDSAASPPPS